MKIQIDYREFDQVKVTITLEGTMGEVMKELPYAEQNLDTFLQEEGVLK